MYNFVTAISGKLRDLYKLGKEKVKWQVKMLYPDTDSDIIPAAKPINTARSQEVKAQIEGRCILEKIEQRIIDLKNSIDMLYQEEQLNQGDAEEELRLELQLKQQTAMTEVRQLSLIKRAIKKGGDPLKVVENIKENLEKKLTNHDELKKCKTQEDISVTNMVLQWIKEGREEGRDDLGQNDLDKKPQSKKPELGKPPRPTEPEGAFYRRVKCLIKMFQGDAGPTESPQHPRVQQDAKISRAR
jgi:hypothetical protein